MDKLAIKQVLVTGAGGFLGRAVCRHLQSQGVRVRALLRKTVAGPWDEVVVVADLADASLLSAGIFSGVDSVFHLAAIAHNRATEADYQRNNVDACINIAKAALAAGVTNFVYVSSSKAVAEPYGRCADETFTDYPTDGYGLSKRKCEEALLALPGFSQLVIARPPLIYGPGVRDNLAMMLRLTDKGIFPPLPALAAPRSMVAASDVARALLLLAREPRAHRNIYFVTDNQPYTMAAIARAMRLALGKHEVRWSVPYFLFQFIGKCGDLVRLVWRRFPLHSGFVHKLLGPAEYSSARLQQEFGWQPQTDFYRELPAIVAAYREAKL